MCELNGLFETQHCKVTGPVKCPQRDNSWPQLRSVHLSSMRQDSGLLPITDTENVKIHQMCHFLFYSHKSGGIKVYTLHNHFIKIMGCRAFNTSADAESRL